MQGGHGRAGQRLLGQPFGIMTDSLMQKANNAPGTGATHRMKSPPQPHCCSLWACTKGLGVTLMTGYSYYNDLKVGGLKEPSADNSVNNKVRNMKIYE